MRKVGRGGNTPFAITTKPNLFTPLSNEELIARKGESALWYRLTPCPCPSGEQTPDCPYCVRGQIRTFTETVLIQEEISEKIQGNQIYTRFGPIDSVEEAVLFQRGEKKYLNLVKIFQDHFEVHESLKYWNQVQLKYRVKLAEALYFEVPVNNSTVVFPKEVNGAIIGVIEAYLKETNEEVKPSGFSLNSVIFPNRLTGTLRLKLNILSPVTIAYKTFTTDPNRRAFEKSQLSFEEGELMAVLGSGYSVGMGDIFTLLVSKVRHSEYIRYQYNSNIDFVSYSPVHRIESVISKEKLGLKTWRVGEDFHLLGDSKILWVSDKPRGGYTITYEYFPTFRVNGFIEEGSGENREKPRLFKMKAVPSFNARESIR